MAHSLSAQKRIRQNAKRRLLNRQRKKLIRVQLKKTETQVTGADTSGAAATLSQSYRLLDRYAAKGTLHKNTAARRKSKLAKKMNAAKNAPATPTA